MNSIVSISFYFNVKGQFTLAIAIINFPLAVFYEGAQGIF